MMKLLRVNLLKTLLVVCTFSIAVACNNESEETEINTTDMADTSQTVLPPVVVDTTINTTDTADTRPVKPGE